MPAKIVVRQGKSRGEQHWIEDEVSRIGSSADCTIVIRGIPKHSLTLLYRRGQYSVVNRDDETIDVAGEPLLPTATLPLRHGDSVFVGANTVLELEIDGDPSPSRRPRSVVTTHDATDSGVEEENGPGVKRPVRQYVLLGTALLAGLYLLFGDALMNSQEARARGTSDAFEDVIGLLQSSGSETNSGPARICAALQRARTSELRGDFERAVTEYEVVRDMVTEIPKRYLDEDVRGATIGLVTNRLGALH